jgi:hypothetical protein
MILETAKSGNTTVQPRFAASALEKLLNLVFFFAFGANRTGVFCTGLGHLV